MSRPAPHSSPAEGANSALVDTDGVGCADEIGGAVGEVEVGVAGGEVAPPHTLLSLPSPSPLLRLLLLLLVLLPAAAASTVKRARHNRTERRTRAGARGSSLLIPKLLLLLMPPPPRSGGERGGAGRSHLQREGDSLSRLHCSAGWNAVASAAAWTGTRGERRRKGAATTCWRRRTRRSSEVAQPRLLQARVRRCRRLRRIRELRGPRALNKDRGSRHRSEQTGRRKMPGARSPLTRGPAAIPSAPREETFPPRCWEARTAAERAGRQRLRA